MSNRIKISDLRFDPENARVRTAKGETMIQESLQQVGAARSIVIDENGTILAGNGTVEAAGQVGIDNVVIVEASGDEIIAVRRKGLTDEQKKKLAYYDNRTGDEAEWDMEQVARDLLGGYDFLDELFDDIQVPEPEKEGTDELPEDPAEVLREKWGVEYGDLWQIGPHRILCGDSTKKEDVDRLLDGAAPNLMVTDPPYGIDIDATWRDGVANKLGVAQKGKIKNDDGFDWAAAFDNSPSSVWYVWHHHALCSVVQGEMEKRGVQIRQQLIWEKTVHSLTMSAYQQMHEPCWYGVRKGANPEWIGGRTEKSVWVAASPKHIMGGSKEEKQPHPTQKPLEVTQIPIRNHKGDVYDPFVGSGTTLVAAHNEGRTCYAMEIDPAYVAVCIERMAQLGYEPIRSEGVKNNTAVQ